MGEQPRTNMKLISATLFVAIAISLPPPMLPVLCQSQHTQPRQQRLPCLLFSRGPGPTWPKAALPRAMRADGATWVQTPALRHYLPHQLMTLRPRCLSWAIAFARPSSTTLYRPTPLLLTAIARPGFQTSLRLLT